METAVGRAGGIVILALLLLGAYALIATPSGNGEVSAAAKLQPMKPPHFSGTMMDGSNI
jgi:hypothetical protein